MLWSIDTSQTKVSADRYHLTISRANSSRAHVRLRKELFHAVHFVEFTY